jgi:phosphoglycolate phosphatase-like HAD superfamily hydrolase
MKYIIFDIDGTLTDTTSVDDDCFIGAFMEIYGIDLSDQDWAIFKNVTDWGITEEILTTHRDNIPNMEEIKALIPRLAERLIEERSADPNRFLPIPGADAFFESMKLSNNCLVGIATGAWEKSAVIKLEGAGFEFHNIPFSNSDHHKSREGIIQHVIQQLDAISGLKKRDIIYFGDGVWDYKTCKNLGIRFVGIDAHRNGKLKSIGASVVFQDYFQIDAIMGWIDNGNWGEICF